jgi:type I restriction enzyme, R subunit
LAKRQIYPRNLERVIEPEDYTPPIDVSNVLLKHAKQDHRGKTDIGLVVRVRLSGITARDRAKA